MLRLGLSRTDITPSAGIYLIGYGDRTGGCTSVRDRLTATAAVWSSEDGYRAAVVFTDLLALNRDVCERIKEKVSCSIKINGIFISCLHTHSGAVAWAPRRIGPVSVMKDFFLRLAALPAGLRQPRGLISNKKYIDSLVDKIAAAVIEASGSGEDVEIFSGSSSLNLGVNRREKTADGRIIIGRNDKGPAPKILRAVQFRRAKDGAAVLNLLNIDCHPVVLGPVSYAVSADWPGEMRRGVEQKLPGLCVVMQGGGADINPEGMKHEAGVTAEIQQADLVAIGKEATDAALNAFETLSPVDGEGGIYAEEIRIDIPVDRGPGYHKALSEMAGMPGWIVDPVLNLRYPWRTETNIVSGSLTTPVFCGLMKIGGLSIAGLSMETFFETAEAVREMLPGTALFSGYTNGLTGYLPTAEAMAAGGYEADLSPYMYRLPGRLSSGSEPMIREGFRELIDRAASRIESTSVSGLASVREMRREDETAVVNVCHKTFDSYPDFPSAELVGYRWASWYVRHSPEYCFAAVDENDMAIGYILCAPDSADFDRGYAGEMVPLIRDRLKRLKNEYPALYKKHRMTFLPPLREYQWPVLKRLTKEYPAHLHVDLLPGYQKSGLGGRMMTALLTKLSDEGIPGVHLIVGADNKNAVGYYRHCGFKIIASRGGERGFYVMGLKLGDWRN